MKGIRPTVLILSGGFGVGPIEDILKGVLTIEIPMEVVVVCGRNAELPRRLAGLPRPERHRVTIVGYTTAIDELMAVADLVITKPGGLTSAEVLARGCAMAIVNPIPGQESRNSDYLLENGAAVKTGPLATLPYKLAALLDDPDRLTQLKTNARRLGRPRAAFTIAETVLALA
jgi:processive 1,2-diacylglycerol beta-glucosyltransferase